jgi:hypothetical protein
MAVIVTTNGTTKVKKIVVGRPVKRINNATGNINTLAGVDTTGAVQGSVLVYDEASSSFIATTELEDTNITGGHY